MPTLKFKAGTSKLAMNAGKLTCVCCETDTCCLYPSAGGSTDEADWPAQVVVNGTTLNLETGAPNTPTYSDGTITLFRVDSSTFRITFASGDLEGAIYESPCLIGDYALTEESDPGFPATATVEDLFNATYTVDYTVDAVPTSDTLTRVSDCCWQGANTCPKLQVCFSAGLWAISVVDSEDGFLRSGNKNDGQDESDPTGDYSDDGSDFNVCSSFLAIGDVVIT